MKQFLITVFFLSTSCLAVYADEIPTKETAQVGIGLDVDVGNDDDEDQVVWIGPGWYYGVWFDNEYEYNDWYHGHHDHHDHHDHHSHHSEHHHGGGHHGGGHGGGHHK